MTPVQESTLLNFSQGVGQMINAQDLRVDTSFASAIMRNEWLTRNDKNNIRKLILHTIRQYAASNANMNGKEILLDAGHLDIKVSDRKVNGDIFYVRKEYCNASISPIKSYIIDIEDDGDACRFDCNGLQIEARVTGSALEIHCGAEQHFIDANSSVECCGKTWGRGSLIAAETSSLDAGPAPPPTPAAVSCNQDDVMLILNVTTEIVQFNSSMLLNSCLNSNQDADINVVDAVMVTI